MNRLTHYLSLNSEKTPLETPLTETPKTPLNTENKTVNGVNCPVLLEQKHRKSEHRKCDNEQYVSARNHDTVIPLESSPYGEVKHPDGVIPPAAMEDENAEYF